ncbi:hypothetical protein ACN6K9_004963 [Streptomyces sp. SAS_267]|uniref:hypothetical protein n=1 Tax=unclassified Streptomyces TaxID=2593676 RepID=UPI0036F65185
MTPPQPPPPHTGPWTICRTWPTEPVLDLLTRQLKDFPRACRTLARAREALGDRTPLPPIPGLGKPV